ncbi:MAG TPA: Rieske 2Fe-2S domain-containing protein [Candidatus Acidoferrales bacterium]|jgi:cytochrome b6-f complex iron-sulfur subunit|nr:Rieske 2Fe-2S domain-containing protein [Candidatus Acidoferrales bacterium]
MPDQNEGKPAEAGATPAPPAAAAPPKPPAKGKKTEAVPADPVDKTRRSMVWAFTWGYLGINLLLFLRFFFPRALYEPNPIFSIGYPADFDLGIDQRFLMTNRVWVIREPGRLFVIFARCTHLGCTPEWKASENKFKCPCHGSGYDSEGVNFEGPAPRPMDRCNLSLDATGKIIVDSSRLYQDDPRAGVNHFNDPGAFLNV